MDTSGNIQDLIDRVMERARAEAAAIVDRARRASERDIQEARNQAGKGLAGIKAEAEAEFDSMRRASLAEIKQRERKAVMGQQEAAVREVFLASIEAVRTSLSAEKRRAALLDAVRSGVATLGGQVARVRMNAADRADALKNGFPGEIGGAEIRIEEDALDCVCGAIVSDEERRVTVDNTFEARLERRRGELRMKVAGCLNLRGMKP
jgi:vacuolar-type H+-ATPase subunit E/Vma4